MTWASTYSTISNSFSAFATLRVLSSPSSARETRKRLASSTRESCWNDCCCAGPRRLPAGRTFFEAFAESLRGALA